VVMERFSFSEGDKKLITEELLDFPALKIVR
jgi:hypothetical protein